jgi:Protein of unknown function (DUF1554)
MRYAGFVIVTIAQAAFVACGGSGNGVTPSATQNSSTMSFFVTSTKSTTANLGGLRGADTLCQRLADTVGNANKTWRAYLSVERDLDNRPTDARARIGNGPWVNANGVLVARDLTELHTRKGDATVFVDEHGQRIPGQWAGSPPPVEHDILTGSNADGTLMRGMTCSDWTSDSASLAAQVGHSDGLGPGGDTSGALTSWNSSHANQSCANTAPRGGAGRIYCFAMY